MREPFLKKVMATGLHPVAITKIDQGTTSFSVFCGLSPLLIL